MQTLIKYFFWFLKNAFFWGIILYISKNFKINHNTKIRYELEFPINSSPQLLYQYISILSGLQEWFADKVNSRGEFFTFIWDDVEEFARLASKKSGEKIKFKWIDDNKRYRVLF